MGHSLIGQMGRSLLLAALLTVNWVGSTTAQAGQGTHPDAATAKLVSEVRRSFQVRGRPVPPGIFWDFGDGDLADSGPIWVTVDVAAATGSNLYADDIEKADGWFSQKLRMRSPRPGEEIAYSYSGATESGLLIVLTRYDGGASGRFFTLHILDLAPASAFDQNGKLYWQINLSLVRSIALGDRWAGEVSIAKNTVKIVTTSSGPADDSGKKRVKTIEAVRP
jgi:hypothetical protein